MPAFEFNFNESRFTESYFKAWEGDIDSDEDFGDVVSSPDEEEPGRRGISGGGSGVNLYHVLRERHA